MFGREWIQKKKYEYVDVSYFFPLVTIMTNCVPLFLMYVRVYACVQTYTYALKALGTMGQRGMGFCT